ncbi:MAG: polysaccharide deacetylase family protein, partial [Pyramidobacter sp.]
MQDHLYWKNGARCAVMLSFDLDGDTTWKNGNAGFPGGEKFLRSCSVGQYGPNRGAGAILDLLKKYGVPGTFFIPGKVAEDHPDLIRRIDAEGHEIGQHGYTHELFFSYTPEQQADIIERCQNIFCDLVGHPARGFRTPSGDWSRGTPKLLLEHGVDYSSSMRG